MAQHTGLRSSLLLSSLPEWLSLLSLIFGGCCWNAYTLELSTRQLPSSGTLITLAQFFATFLSSLPSHLHIPAGAWVPRLVERKVPLWRWGVQVSLYLSTSLLNNVAFAYDIPMPVHIVFRSGGLVVNLFLGWAVQRRRYSSMQVASVFLVTAGVAMATLASSNSHENGKGGGGEGYATGVLLLFTALVLTGLMGLWQEATFARYGTSNWRESMFYSHALSLPFFALRLPSLRKEIALANATPPLHLSVPEFGFKMSIPDFWPPLLANVLTQLACINGVNRLTSKVTSLTVTLVLVVRKAVSLVLSAAWFGGGGEREMWAGAAAVLAGTVGYSLATARVQKQKHKTQ